MTKKLPDVRPKTVIDQILSYLWSEFVRSKRKTLRPDVKWVCRSAILDFDSKHVTALHSWAIIRLKLQNLLTSCT